MHVAGPDRDRHARHGLGGAVPLVRLAFCLIQPALAVVLPESYPTISDRWHSVFGRSRLLGRISLEVFDVYSIAALGLFFRAPTVALRADQRSRVVAGAFLALLRVDGFASSRAAGIAGTLSLSEQYASASAALRRHAPRLAAAR